MTLPSGEGGTSKSLQDLTGESRGEEGEEEGVLEDMDERNRVRQEAELSAILQEVMGSEVDPADFPMELHRQADVMSSLGTRSSISSGQVGVMESTTGQPSIHYDFQSSTLASSYPTSSGLAEEEGEMEGEDGPSSDVLIVNQAYQEIMEKVIEQVETSLNQVRKQQKVIQNCLDQTHGEGSAKKHTKVPVLLYMPPYFKDFSNMAPPPNQDVIDKRERGEHDPLVQPSKKWTNAECQKLKKAVKDSVITEKTRHFISRSELIDEKKRQLIDPKAVSKCRQEMEDIDKKILAVKRLKTEQLYAEDCDIDWVTIANFVFSGTREPLECQLKWEQDLHPGVNRERWTGDEEKQLKFLVEQKGLKNWEHIAEALQTQRTAFAVFEKYQTKLNDSLMKGPWEKEEDEKLVAIVSALKVGNHIPWEQVSYYMDGRTRVQVQTRWLRSLDPKVKKGRWTEEEDLLLMVAVQKFGARDWCKVAQGVPSRTDAQCRERWCSTLDSSVKLGDWTQAEDDILDFAVRQFGEGEWAKVSKLLIGRPPGACKQRYKTLQMRAEGRKSPERGGRSPSKRGGGKGRRLKRESGSGGEELNDPDWGEEEDLDRKPQKEDNRNNFDANFERLEKIKQRKKRVRERFRELAGEDLEPLLPTGEDAVELYLDTIPDEAVRKLIRSKLTSIHSRYSEKNEWTTAGYVKPAPKRRKVEVVAFEPRTEEMEKREVESQLREAVRKIQETEYARKMKIKRQNIQLVTKGLYSDMLEEAGRREKDLCFPPSGCSLEGVVNLLGQRQKLLASATAMFHEEQQIPHKEALVKQWIELEKSDPLTREDGPSRYVPEKNFKKVWSQGKMKEFRNRFNAIFHWPMVMNDLPVAVQGTPDETI